MRVVNKRSNRDNLQTATKIANNIRDWFTSLSNESIAAMINKEQIGNVLNTHIKYNPLCINYADY